MPEGDGPAPAPPDSTAHEGAARARRALGLTLMAATFSCVAILLWVVAGPNLVSSRVLGIPSVSSATLPTNSPITLSSRSGDFTPRATVIATGGTVTFLNSSAAWMKIRSAARSPTSFSVSIGPHKLGSLRLVHVGLYHYYNALTTRTLSIVANNEVLRNKVKTRVPSEGWIVVLPTSPGLEAHLNVPIGEGVFAPKALVTVVGATVIVANHDRIAHNFVIDPASPSGAAFIVGGTDANTPSGWQRALVIQQPGLYHVYCTLHTRVIGVVDGWHVVVPNEFSAGFLNGNPMEAWIIALPATTT